MTVTEPFSQGGATALQEIAAAAIRLTAALERRDPRGIAACYSTGALLQPSGHPVVAGRSGIAAFWWAGIESGLRRLQREPRSVEIRGDLAVEVGRLAAWLEPPEVPAVCERGTYVVLHRREADGWMRAVEILDLDAPPAGQPVRPV